MIASVRSLLRGLGIPLLTAVMVLSAAAGSQAKGHPAASRNALSLHQRVLAYAQCMRQHGLPTFPDPSNGAPPHGNGVSMGFSANGQTYSFNFNGTGIDPRSPQFQTAQQACHAKLGFQGAGPATSSGATAKFKQDALKFAACMRQSGLPTFPDPTFGKSATPGSPDAGGMLTIARPGLTMTFNLQGIDMKSAQYQKALHECQPRLHMQAPGKVTAP